MAFKAFLEPDLMKLERKYENVSKSFHAKLPTNIDKTLGSQDEMLDSKYYSKNDVAYV